MKEYENLNEQDKIKAENDFLKMKMMLERGAQFHGPDDGQEVSPEIENEFLKNIIAFEKQYDEHKTITIFEKIGKPTHFKPANEITDAGIEEAWRALLSYMSDYGVEVSSYSPRVTTRELYRFTTEELFNHETDDIRIPGWFCGYVYDEFYPDHEYENSRSAINDCIKRIFEKEPLEWMHHYTEKNIRLNNHYPLSRDELQNILNTFKEVFEEIELTQVDCISSLMVNDNCTTKGNYSAIGKLEKDTMQWSGNWRIEFERKQEDEYWYITEVEIEGINL